MIANILIICVWSPNLDTDAPNWINFSFAAGLWLYSTFDNVDGRQARRTGTSSPLGELFDHGCDAVNCTYVALLQAAALGLGHSVSAAILLFVSIAGFYLSTAEEYYTGVLYLGYVNGPTEGIIVTCLAFIWSGVYGKYIYIIIQCVWDKGDLNTMYFNRCCFMARACGRDRMACLDFP